ncbi:MAG: sodium:proton antiporter [Clostridiales Family XIII bacterium]|jgi:Na+/H+ antiporter NhaC|nr:sodium:proton antiporter [Clostridiales Family XIII bacterium]
MLKRTRIIIPLSFIAVLAFAAAAHAAGGGEEIVSYGMLSLIPPLVTILLAFITKQTVISMFIGVWVGSTIINGWNPLTGLIKCFTDWVIPQIADSWNAGMLVIMIFIGGFIYMLGAAGGAAAFEKFGERHVNSRTKAQLLTWVAPFVFIFNQGCLLVGVIMRPITDKQRVSRVKLAYFTDSLGAPLVSMSPISDNGVYLVGLITAQIAGLGLSGVSEWGLYFGMFPFNLYGICSVLAALAVIFMKLDIGAMGKAERLAMETGKVYGDNDKLIASPPPSDIPEGYNVTYKNIVAPLLTFVAVIFGTIFYTGKIWENGFVGSFTNANIQMAIALAFLIGAVAASAVAVGGKLMTAQTAIDRWISGGGMMVNVILILVMAWSISALTKHMQIGPFLTGVVQAGIMPQLIPAIIFLLGVVISFATGSSWGVWALGMPIAIPMAHELGLSIPLAIGAVVSGGLFGDHCSPISDTTIQSSTGACCDHLEHVKTQLPYALIVGGSAFFGYLAAGFTTPLMGMPVTLALVIAALLVAKRRDASVPKAA